MHRLPRRSPSRLPVRLALERLPARGLMTVERQDQNLYHAKATAFRDHPARDDDVGIATPSIAPEHRSAATLSTQHN